MNFAHLHLVLNHIPPIGSLFGIVFLAVAVRKKSEELKRLSFIVFVAIALIAVPVFLTGAPAAEIVEKLPGVSETAIEQHEEAALISLIAVEVLGAAALAGLIVFRRSTGIPTWCATVALLLSLIVGALMGWTSNLGGQIRHTEIRAEFKASLPGPRAKIETRRCLDARLPGASCLAATGFHLACVRAANSDAA